MELSLTVYKNRRDNKGQVKQYTLQQLTELLGTCRTCDAKESGKYVKDSAGAFVGGVMNGPRSISSLVNRTFLTLDIDDIKGVNVSALMTQAAFKYFMYTTNSSTPATPRYRIVIPLATPINHDMYELIAREVAYGLGVLHLLDECSYVPAQLMYFPSAPSERVKYFEAFTNDTEVLLDPEEVLVAFRLREDTTDYTDRSKWRGNNIATKSTSSSYSPNDEYPDPLEGRPWYIQQFCEAYPGKVAIEKFLNDVYQSTNDTTLFKLKASHSEPGLKIIAPHVFVSHHHNRDPVAKYKKVNEYDLVRLHKFPVEEMGDRESQLQMAAFAKKLIYEADIDLEDLNPTLELTATAAAQLNDKQISSAWKMSLEMDKDKIKLTPNNILIILNNDEEVSGMFGFDTLTQTIKVLKKTPWKRMKSKSLTDIDIANLIIWFSKKYKLTVAKQMILTCVDAVASENLFNDLVDNYINKLPEWDGTKRIEHLLIDYLGCEDSIYSRQIAEAFLHGAIKRALEPGCKFDTMLLLLGPQGIGKSTIFNKLCPEGYFTDNLTLTDMTDKDGALKIADSWIVEVAELASGRYSEIESTKAFISRTEDHLRRPYGAFTEKRPRHCVFIGTSNNYEDGVLNDATGNRRFWPITCFGETQKKAWEITNEERDQLWAEALALYNKNKEYRFSEEVFDAMQEEQEKASVEDPLTSSILEYCKTSNLKYICGKHVWCDVLNKELADFDLLNSKRISKALKKLGFKYVGRVKTEAFGQQRCYEVGVMKTPSIVKDERIAE